MKRKNIEEENNVIVHISNPILVDYLFDYYSENIQKETFKLIKEFEKNLKYKISIEDKKEYTKIEIENYLNQDHLELFKKLKFSIVNNEIILDRNWLIDVLENYPSEGINLTLINNPQIAFGDKYHYKEIIDEEELYEILEYEKPNFIKEISSFIFADYLIENENKPLNNIISKKDEVLEELNLNQIQKIGLLKRSGIIDFLRNNNKLTNNQIAKFIDIITKEHLKQASITSHLIDETSNSKHPFHKNGSIESIDFILKKCGINPQSEK